MDCLTTSNAEDVDSGTRRRCDCAAPGRDDPEARADHRLQPWGAQTRSASAILPVCSEIE